MKKVDLSVEFIDENNNIVFAVLFVGVITRHNLYVKRVSSIDSRPEDDYIKIQKKDVILDANVESAYDVTHYSISVPDELGLDDPRITSGINNADIISEIEQCVIEFNEAAAC